MDYRYIEQLLDRYWACETTLHEEQILRTFFQQEEVPAHLQAYRDVFMAEQEQAEACLGEDFDRKMLELTGEQEQVCQARKLTFARRIRPLYQAAGLIALLLTIGTAAQHSMAGKEEQEQPTQAAIEQHEGDSSGSVFTPIPDQQSASIPQEDDDSLGYTR